jgi:pimeloyl-ACP methyl ester carboxylesterase
MDQIIEFKNSTDNTLRGVLRKAAGNDIVICIHGFEGTATTAKKFKILADDLLKNNFSSLRLDLTGNGLSDGDFRYTTVAKMTDDLERALDEAKKYGDKIHIIAHSLGACVVANYIKHVTDAHFHSIILLAPALNQKALLRLWFVSSQTKKKELNLKITWDNYRDYLDERLFLKDCARQDKMTGSNYIAADYFLENKDVDYVTEFQDSGNILHIHGDNDDIVPLGSVNIAFKNQIIVKSGDHNLERPDMIEQWLEKTADFIRLSYKTNYKEPNLTDLV